MAIDTTSRRFDSIITRFAWVAALDALGERNLLGRGQELVTADVGQEELKAVGGARNRAGLVLLGGSVFLLGVDVGLRDFDVVRLELALEQLGVLVADVVLEHERLELGCLEPPCSSARSIRAFTCSDSNSSMSWFCVKFVFQSFRALFRGSDKLTESTAVSFLFQRDL